MKQSNKSKIFPCKSINLNRFLESKEIYCDHEYIDVKDSRICWLYIQNKKLSDALIEWSNNKKNKS